ncbi:MAG: EF-hand domain-containing protein, partial [Candidatus Thermoplasmatota archaeon]|nr:EF-hand domain-containing protein [Candidatus Thermoplasmatota archaeon]
MSDTDKEDVPMAECGSCRAIIPLDSKQCPECGIGFSGVSDEALGECGACNSLVPINSKSCPECGVYFVADNVVNVLKEWFINTGIDSRKLFAKFDSDSDGHIDADELKDGLLKMNLADLPPSQIDRLITEVDTDNDGVISLDELVSAITDEPAEDNQSDSDSSASAKQYSENVVERVMNKHEITDKEHFLAFAASFDENENDYLTEAELKKAAAAYLEQVDAGEEAQELDEIVTDVSAGEHITEEDSDVVDETTDESEMVEEAEIDGMVADPDDDDEQTDDDTAAITEEETTSDQYLAKLVAAANDQDLTIRDMFESIDVDKNGLIDGPELQKGINSIAGDYLSPGDIMGIISLVDKDSDGRINAFELIEVIESMDTGIESDRLNEPMDVLLDYIDSMDVDVAAMFRNLDKNRDGKINREELANALNEHSNEEVDEEAITNLVNMFDVDGNDSIDLFEFIETLEAHDDQLPDENTYLSSPKEFPSNMQKRMMSKRWK